MNGRVYFLYPLIHYALPPFDAKPGKTYYFIVLPGFIWWKAPCFQCSIQALKSQQKNINPLTITSLASWSYAFLFSVWPEVIQLIFCRCKAEFLIIWFTATKSPRLWRGQYSILTYCNKSKLLFISLLQIQHRLLFHWQHHCLVVRRLHRDQPVDLPVAVLCKSLRWRLSMQHSFRS